METGALVEILQKKILIGLDMKPSEAERLVAKWELEEAMEKAKQVSENENTSEAKKFLERMNATSAKSSNASAWYPMLVSEDVSHFRSGRR